MVREMRTIITIDEEKCDGCGLCVAACHEGALALVNGKAVLTHEYYCDGLGDCLPACPQDAISFEEREAESYDEDAVTAHLANTQKATAKMQGGEERASQLRQWPVQIKLVSPDAPYFEGADLLIAADCCAFAYAGFHEDYMAGKITLIGCPKLDAIDYADKLTEIFRKHEVNSVTVARMQVPCCGGIEHAAKTAVSSSGKDIPLTVVTFATNGQVVS